MREEHISNPPDSPPHSFVKPFLGEKEKKVFFGVLFLQVIDNIALLVVQETTPGTNAYMTWENLFRFVDMCCCAAILFPIVWQIRALEEVVQENDKAVRTIEKVRFWWAEKEGRAQRQRVACRGC
jgi:G protein-coupled receptor 107